eukprot:7384933-Prymnesium_polylepis.1
MRFPQTVAHCWVTAPPWCQLSCAAELGVCGPTTVLAKQAAEQLRALASIDPAVDDFVTDGV